ncbi:hypothetical protein [Minwuia sp.]|uniref:hypothetical protein n=1 Tax=Minwuia sp. TaxID=2493630 RepID=UPI003A91D324
MASRRDRAGDDVEDDFVSPLTMIRGVLEMLHDSDDLPDTVRRRFLELALDDCDRLGESIDRLIENNPDFVKRAAGATPSDRVSAGPDRGALAARVSFLEADRIAELDFSDLSFEGADAIDAFHDVIDDILHATGRQWYLMVNFRNCTIDPAAWVAFSHRGKKTNLAYSLGTVRYAVPVDSRNELREQSGGQSGDDGMFRSRQAAIDFLRRERAGTGN